MPSFKHVFLALACLASQLATTSASPTSLRVRSETAYPTTVSTVMSTVPASGAAGRVSGIAKPTGAHHCDDVPGNHTRAHPHDHHHRNHTGGPDLDLHTNRTDLLRPSGTPTVTPASLITPAPDATAVTNAKAIKFVQTTYYSCVTIGPDSHCGWHEPILDASMPNAAAGRAVGRMAWLLVGLVGVMWM